MGVQDDLANLFAKNLTLTPQPAPPPPYPDDKIVYISQHYTHTAHISNPAHIPRPTSEPADLADLEHMLRNHGVETTTLTLPQVELFRRADDAQKARLVQLWTICPPAAQHNTTHGITWSATSLEQEELLARRRHDEQQQQQQQHAAPEMVMSLDGTEVDMGMLQLSNSPGSMQSAGGSAWESSPGVVHAHTYMEPYMQSGYEELARREYDNGSSVSRKAALDPVYNQQGETLDWERQQWMENQYGAFVGGWRDDEEML